MGHPCTNHLPCALCTSHHLADVADFEKLKAAGAEVIVCVAVNDAFAVRKQCMGRPWGGGLLRAAVLGGCPTCLGQQRCLWMGARAAAAAAAAATAAAQAAAARRLTLLAQRFPINPSTDGRLGPGQQHRRQGAELAAGAAVVPLWGAVLMGWHGWGAYVPLNQKQCPHRNAPPTCMHHCSRTGGHAGRCAC